MQLLLMPRKLDRTGETLGEVLAAEIELNRELCWVHNSEEWFKGRHCK